MVPLQSKFPINAFITPRELLRRGDLIWLFWRSYLRLDGHTQPRNLIRHEACDLLAAQLDRPFRRTALAGERLE
jgi:hypothetical protein